MSDIYTTEGQSQSNSETNIASRVSDGSKVSGVVRHFVATRVVEDTGDGADTTADVLSIIKLPVGARVIPDSLRVYADDPGTTYEIDTIGDLADPDRYSATQIVASAGGYFAVTPAVTGPVNDYQVGDDAADTGWLTATLGTVASPTDGADITFTGSYSLAN